MLKIILSIFPREYCYKVMIQFYHRQGQEHYKVNREKRFIKSMDKKAIIKSMDKREFIKSMGKKQLYKVISQKNVEYCKSMEKKPTGVGFFTTLPRESAKSSTGPRPARSRRPYRARPGLFPAVGAGNGSWSWEWELEAGS